MAVVKATHEGTADNYKGQLLFYTNDGDDNDIGQLALTISSAQLATFAGNITAQDITASNGTITVGTDGATITGTTNNSNVLTLTEDTVATSAALTVGTHLTVNGNIIGDDDEAKIIFAASAAEASTITLGGGGTVIVGGAGKLRLGTSNIIENTAGETTITLNADQRTTLSGDLAVVGGATNGLAATTILLGASDANRDSAIKVVARTGANAGQDLTIEAGSTAQGANDLNGGDLILKSGSGDGNGTSDIEFWTLTTNAENSTQKMTLKGSGRLGIGETSPDSILHITDTAPSIKVLNTTHGDGAGDRSSNVAFFGEKSGGEEGQLAQITASHDGAADDFKGKLVLGVNQNDDATTIVDVLTLASDKSAKFEGATTFEGAVTIKGNLDIQNTGTLTTIDTTNLSVSDKVIELARNADDAVINNATNDVGFVFTRGRTNGADAATVQDPAVFYWDEGFTGGRFVLATKEGASTSTADFSAGNAPVEARLDVGTLNADFVVLDSTDATSLVFKESDNTTYLTFDTTDGSENVEFGQKIIAPTGSKIADIEITTGVIQTTTGNNNLSFNDNNLSTSGTANFGATTVDSLTFDPASGGITLVGAISGVTNISGTSMDITLANDDADALEIMGDVGAGDVGDHAYLSFVTTNEAEEVVVNQEAQVLKFRVEGSGDANLIITDPTNDRVGIKTANGQPAYDLDITGTLGVSGLANFHSLEIDNGGNKFTVSNAGALVAAGASQVTNTFNVSTNSAAAFVVEKTDGTDVFNIDTSNADVANAVSTLQGTLKVDHLQSATGTTGNFTIEIADNVADALTIQDATNGLDFIQINSTDDAELITLAQATSLSETLSVTGIATFINTVKLEDSSGGIIFNSDDTAAAAEANATMLTVERGELTNAIIAWDEATDEFNFNSVSGVHLVGKNGSNALTVGGANSGAAAITFSVSTAGAVVSVGGITDTTVASAFKDGTTLGNVTYNNNEIVGANAQDLTIKSKQDIIFNIDSDANDGAGKKFSFSHNANAEIASINDSGDLTLTGDATLNGGDLTVKNATAAGHAVISLISDNASNDGDTWKFEAVDNSATLTITNDISNSDVAQLTLLGTAVAVNGLATFAGDVTTNGDVLTINSVTLTSDGTDFETSGDLTVAGGVFTVKAPDATASEIQLQASLGTANGDSWKITGADEDTRTLTFSGQNTNNANYQNVLVLKAENTLTDSLATFGGDITVSGGTINLTNGSIIDSSTAGTLLLTEDIVKTSGDLQVGGDDIKNANGDTVITFAGAGVSTTLTATTTIASGILQVNGNITGDADEAKTIFATTTTEARLITLGGGGTVKTAGKLRVTGNHIEDSGNSTAIQFDGSQNTTIKGNLTIDGLLTGSSTTGHVSFKDRILALATSNASSSNPVGFYGLYRDTDDAEYYNGLLYVPDNTAGGALGSWKLFHTNTSISDDQETSATILDAQLGILDIGTVRGGSKVGVGVDQAGTNLTLSGGASTGDGAGGSILFKVAPASQGAGATERLPTTTALTIASTKLATFAGNVTVSGNTLTFGNGATIVNGGADTLTITEPTVEFSAAVTVGTNLRINGNIIQNSEGTTTLTMDTDEGITVAGSLTVQGGEVSVPSSGGTDTLDANEYIYLATDNSTITLPAPALGRKYLIKLAAAHTNGVTINTNDTANVKIDGSGTQTLASDYAFIEIVATADHWFIIGKSGTVNASN